jgi:hypothetical protein
MLRAYATVGDKNSLAKANKAFLKVFQDRSSASAKQTIGTPGGSVQLATWFSADLDTWVAPDVLANRYWNAFGYGDPFVRSKVAPTVEINPPLAAGTSKTATLILRNQDGEFEIAHTGGAGGGKTGIGMNAFKAFHPSYETVIVDGKARDLYMLGALADEDDLAANVADYVKVVRDFKAGPTSSKAPPFKKPFKPEFDGTTTFAVSTNRSATYRHGRVVNALHADLARRNVAAHRTTEIDLYAEAEATRRGVIFEAKSAPDTQSVYTCIGQLAYNCPVAAWIKVAVLPEHAPSKIVARLQHLEIFVLSYSMPATGVPRFTNLDELMNVLAIAPVE